MGSDTLLRTLWAPCSNLHRAPCLMGWLNTGLAYLVPTTTPSRALFHLTLMWIPTSTCLVLTEPPGHYRSLPDATCASGPHGPGLAAAGQGSQSRGGRSSHKGRLWAVQEMLRGGRPALGPGGPVLHTQRRRLHRRAAPLSWIWK